MAESYKNNQQKKCPVKAGEFGLPLYSSALLSSSCANKRKKVKGSSSKNLLFFSAPSSKFKEAIIPIIAGAILLGVIAVWLFSTIIHPILSLIFK